jgi:acetyl esterase/lipase
LEQQITDHYPSTNKNYPGMLMSVKDPRWRFVLHMNWRAQTLPLLLNGLPTKATLQATPNSPPEDHFYNLPQPPADKVLAMNPYGQIVRGTYKTPTFLLHGTADDLIPWGQSVETVRALQRNGITADVAILKDVIHLFDTFGGGGPEGDAAIRRGYEFLLRHAL